MADDILTMTRGQLAAEVRRLRASEETLRRDLALAEATRDKAQAASTRDLDYARGTRLIANASPGLIHVLGHVAHERSRQDEVHGPVGTLVNVPFHTGPEWSDLLDRIRYESAMYVKAVGCESWSHAVMEEAAEFACETDEKRMRAELVQLSALAAKVCEVIDARAR